MNTRFWKSFTSVFAILVILSLIPLSCAPKETPLPVSSPEEKPASVDSPTSVPTNTKIPLSQTATSVPLPEIMLEEGNFYFTVDGLESFVLSRNPTGKSQADFDNVLNWAQQGGSKILRVHLTHGWWGEAWIETDGSLDPAWIADWEHFFDQAEADGIYIIPVFGVWADWNNNIPDYGSPFWQYNPAQ